MSSRNAFTPLLTILSFLLLLYFAKPVLVPFSLAVLLSFVLSPLVDRLDQRLRIRRVIGVTLVTVSVFVLIAILAWVLFTQFLNVARELPRYKDNLRTKVAELKDPVGPGLERTWRTMEELGRELSFTQAGKPKVIEVEVREPAPSAIQLIRAMLAPIVKPLGTAGIVIVFTVFMLLKREELRDKIIKLIGPQRITVTTEVINEATTRVSRYLQMQTLINGGQGLVVGILLYIIGVPYAGLWGILSAVLRFIPYLGPWLGAIMPITLSIIVFDSWTEPLITILIFACVELISNNVLEPWLLGASTGVSSMALIVAAVFWTWLWGTAGLLLSTPLTACLVVLGKYIPQLNFLYILLGDEPVLSPAERFYHRLLSADVMQADRVIQKELKDRTIDEVSESLLLPALHLAEKHLHTRALDEARYEQVIGKMKEVILAMYESHEKEDSTRLPSKIGIVLCIPARDVVDEVASIIFAAILRTKGIDGQWVSEEALAGELLEIIEDKQPAAVCISAFPPYAINRAKYLCKRLHNRYPDLRILAGMWEAGVELDPAKEILTQAGAELVVSNLSEGVSQIQQWIAHTEVNA